MPDGNAGNGLAAEDLHFARNPLRFAQQAGGAGKSLQHAMAAWVLPRM